MKMKKSNQLFPICFINIKFFLQNPYLYLIEKTICFYNILIYNSPKISYFFFCSTFSIEGNFRINEKSTIFNI